MNDHSKLIDSSKSGLSYLGPYQEIALYVRDLLKCDFAAVAVPEKDSIRILAITGSEGERPINLAADLLSRLRDWGPVVVDDSRMIAAPVICDSLIIGVIVGYSHEPGTFTANDLEKLLEYSDIAKGILVNAGSGDAQKPTNFSAKELLHFSRLITIGELSACFAHEVTNPLMLIRGHLKIAEESLPSEHPLQKNLQVIDRASRRIEEMAKRMLDFSKKRAVRREADDLAEVISEALRFVEPYLRAQFVEVQVHLEPGIPLLGMDRWQIIQAIVNIVKNAADAMSGRERRILSITAGVEETQLRIAISDTGPGISPANVEKIFEPFFTTKGERGTGLGLHITKQAIEEHGGTIQVQTGEGGTIFLISLPL